ncbi:MAG: SDR family oxidoreductase [Acidobacteria bacterium]|nr:SDR family oxidoreductase [Acidobacteriota bacterium]
MIATAKAGVNALTRGIAIQYGRDGIRANAVCPGLVDGSQTRALAACFTSEVDAWLQRFARENQCLPELIQPEDIGNAVVFLASPLSRCLTGATLAVDGGTLALMVAG